MLRLFGLAAILVATPVGLSAQETGNGQRETAADAAAESTDDGDAASEQSTTTRAVTVPDIGDYSDVPVIEVLVADGDTVE